MGGKTGKDDPRKVPGLEEKFPHQLNKKETPNGLQFSPRTDNCEKTQQK